MEKILGFNFRYLAWSNDLYHPSWVHGWCGGCASLPDACTDCSRASRRVPTPPPTTPNVESHCKEIITKHCKIIKDNFKNYFCR